MAEQKKRTSEGLYSALQQISDEEGVDFGLSGMSANDFKKKYFTGPGNIENLYHRLNKISREEGIDFGQGSRDEWLSSFGYKRNANGERGYMTLDGRVVGSRKAPAPKPQPQRSDSVNAIDGYTFTEGGLDSAFNQGFPVRAVDSQGRPQGSQPQPRRNGKVASFGTPYKPDSELTAAQRDEIYKRNDFAVRQMRQMERRMREEQQRRNQPIFDTGDEGVNRHVIKTQGQWEDELQGGVSELGKKYVTPLVSKAMKQAEDAWYESMRESSSAPMGDGMELHGLRRANEAADPDKILQGLQQSLEQAYNNPQMQADIEQRANAAGIPKEDYISKVVVPSLRQQMESEFASSQIARNMPRNAVEYVLQGLGNSVGGMLMSAATETKSQQAYKNQAAAMTEEGQNPYYQPGTAARLTQMGVTFAADAPFFGLYGKVGGSVAKHVAEREIKKLMAKGLSEGAARSVVGTALENSVGARMKNYLMQHVISSSITMGGFNMTSEVARQMRDSEFAPGQILTSGLEGAATGAAFGVTGGAVQAVSQPLRGIARIGSKAGGFLAEAETMYATEELAKMVHGEEGFTNPFEGSVEALMKLGVMKASSGHPLMKAVETGASIRKNGLGKTIGNALSPKQSGMRFTPEEEAYVRNSTEGKNLLDALSRLHPEVAVSEAGGKMKLTPEGEQLRQRLARNYSDFMGNQDIPYSVKMKVARALGGLMPDAAHTPLETGADIIHNADGSVFLKTRDKDGNCMQDLKFDTFSDAEAWRDAHEEQFRLNDAVNMWNESSTEARGKMLGEVMEEYGVDVRKAREMIDATLDGALGTSFDNEQFLNIYDTIHRNAYPADEAHTKRNYWEGMKLTPEERHQAMMEAQRAEERLEYMDGEFADEVKGAADYTDEKIAELAGRDEITGEQLEAAIDYYNKVAKANGMMEEALNSVDRQVEAANAFIRRNTHTGSGQLIECAKGDRGYYVTAGNLKLNPDGSIDMQGSGDVVIMRDKNTGEIEVVTPRDVKVTAISDPRRMMAENDSMDGLRGQLMKEADDSISLAADTPKEPQNGDMFLGEDGMRWMTMQADDGTGNPVWAKIALDEQMQPVGEPQPLDVDEYRRAKSIEIDEQNMPREEQPAADTEAAEEPLEETATEVAVPEKSRVSGAGGGETSAAVQPHSDVDVSDEGGRGNQDAPLPPVGQTAIRIPVDQKGRPQYEQATPEDTMSELTEKYGEEKAQRMVATMAENTRRAFEELQQKDTSKMTDMADLAAHEDALADAERKAAYWQQFVKKEEPKAEQPVTVPPAEETKVDEPAIEQPAAEPVPPVAESPAQEPYTETPPPPELHQEPVQPQQPQTPVQPPVQPQQPTGQEKIYRGSTEANVGRTFTFTNSAGVRSELTIRRVDADGNALVSRRDYDAQGNPTGEAREESYAATKVGEAIVSGTWKQVKSVEERLREAYKGRIGIQNIIDVLTEPEMERMLAATEKGDKEALREMQNEFVETHREDIILKTRDKRNQSVSGILSGGFSIGEKLRRIRKQFQGYDDAEMMLSDEALQPSTLDEYVADLHSSVPKQGEGPIAYFSYEKDGMKVVGMQDETGHGTKTGGDTKGYAPWLAPKGKGMSLQKYAENIHSQLPEGIKEQYTDQDVRNAILEVFGGAERPSDIPTMIIRRGVLQAEQAARRMEEMWIDGVSYQKKPKSFAERLQRGIEQTSQEPTDAQKEAGNYAKGHVTFGGYHFTIENPAGSVRRGTDADGHQWEQQMHHTYGYILGRYGKDGDHLDMFINDKADLDEWNGRVYVVDQIDPKTGKFDEHKCLYGFDSLEEARRAYLSNYEDGWQGLGSITGVSKEKFDEWVDSSKRKMKPFAEHSIGREAAVEDVRERIRQEQQRQQEAAAREQVLLDAAIEHLQKHGMEVITDEEGQRVIDRFNGRLTDDVKQMGSRVDSKKKQLSDEIGQRELSEAQQTVVDVFTGRSDNQPITVSRAGKDLTVKMRQGNESGAGTKHSLFRHYGTGTGVVTADDVMRIPDVLANGERKQKQRGKTRLNVYQLTAEDGTKYTVLTEINNRGNEVFNDFYTNRKASSAARLTGENSTARRIDNVNGHTNTQLSAQADANNASDKASNQTPQMPNGDTPEGARTNDLNASSGAKVQQNPDTTKDSGEKQPKFFKTPDGEAYGFTYQGRMYIDKRIANVETPVHEYGHLWAEMKRTSAPEEWSDMKRVLLGDKLIKPILDKVRDEYPELTTEGKEDDFMEEVLTQFSGRRGAERLREVAEQVARENGGIFGKAEAVTAMQRLKNVLNRFWESVARMLGVKYRNANDIADMMMKDFLNGVDPRKQMKGAQDDAMSQQREIERTLMGVHNVSEEKLRKIIKQGGLANPSLAVIDTKNHIHTDYGEISLIPRSSMIDAKTGRNAGTWTADAWTPTYPQVTKRMSSKGQDKYWAETRKSLGDEPGDIRSKTMMAFESWMENGVSPERLSYWYLKERGRKPEQVMYEPSMAKEDIEAYHQAMDGHDRFSELDEAGRKAVLALIAKDRGETPDEMAAKMQELKERNTQRMNDESVKAFVKMRAERVIGEIDEYGVPYSYISDYDYKVKNAEKTDGKLNVDATLGKAAELVKSEGLEEDFGKWLDEKEKSYGIEEWLYNGTDSEGRQKWVRNTLENASKLMKMQGRNGAHGMATGNLIATVAKRVTTLDQIRKERGNLNTTLEEHEAFKEQWGNALLELCNKCGDELWVGEARLQEALGEKNPTAYLKKEYGVELSREDADLLNTFIKEVRENFPTGYFETKFERPVMLDEFEIAVVPENTSPEVVQALKDAGLDVRTYDGTGSLEQQAENRRRATMDAIQNRDDIMFQKGGSAEPFSLSDSQKDAEGNSFYERKGSVDLWSISPLFNKAGRQDAPIRLTERNANHIMSSHGNVFKSEQDVFDFLDGVFSNATKLRRGRGRGMFVVVENDKTDQAAIIKLMPSESGDYYNVETAGYYRKSKWKDSEEVIADLSEPSQSDAAADASKPQIPNDNGREPINAEAQVPSSAGKDTNNSPNFQENGGENADGGLKFQKVSHPEPEMTPEERQYWKEWDKAMRKWRERNGIGADETGPGEKPQFQPGEMALDFAKRLMRHKRQEALWRTAPKLKDYQQVRDDKDSQELAREQEKAYPDSQWARMQRVAADMARLRHSMSRQKEYDKATVKAVTDFAHDFMTMGFGDNLSRGEMERILSSVKNATGAKDIRQQIDNVMNILIDNQLRNLDQQVVKLSSVKELKQTAQGVEAQGRLELKGQRMIQAFREARQERMTVEKIRERMAEVSEKMTRNDEEAPMWEQEYEGLTIALQYAENIEGSREEWADLNREYKDAVKEYKQSGRSYKAQQELLESLEQAMVENKVERIGMFGDIIGRLQGNIAESMEGAKAFVEREKQRIKHIQDMANFDTAGQDMGALRVDGKGKATAKGKAANFFLQPLGTFEQMLRQFGSRNANGEGYLYDHFMRTWMDATDRAYVNEVKAKEELDAKARELFGGKVKRWSDLYAISNKEAAEVEVADQGEPKTLRLTQGNLLYIYMADKMADGRMKLRKMGITEEQVEQIKEQIDPRLVQLGDWLQDEYLVGKRTEYNKVHERMFGAPMAAIDHYFPLKILGDARVQEQDVATMTDQDAVLPSTITGNIIKRRKNALPLDILHTDALSLALEHVGDMERWAATAEWNKDVNTLLSYTTFRNKVKNMKTIYGSGDELWNNFADTARMAAGTYRPKTKKGSVDSAISNIAKGVTAAKINFRVYTAFKQILSAPAFLHDVNLGDFVKYSVNPYGSWKWAMENMPVFRKRWESRQVGDTRLMDDATDWKMWKTNLVQKATMWGMSPNALVDGVTCAVGARAIYETRYRKYKGIGASDEVARKRALQDAEIGYNLTQQSSEGAFVSRIQKDRTVAANMLSVFRNSSMAYTRQWVDASRNLRRRMQKGYKEDSIQFMARQIAEQFNLDEAQARKAAEAEYARAGRRDVARLLNMMFGVTVAWNLGASLPYLLIGDDDKTKQEMMTDALVKGLIAGPTEGFAAGNIMSEIVGRMTSEQTRNTIKDEGWGAGVDAALKQAGDYEVNPLPLMADIQGMIGKMGYDKYAAAQDVFNICMQSAVGVNPQTFTDMFNACMDYGAPAWDGTKITDAEKDFARPKEIALFIMRLMNAPTSSWRNKYIDELGMSAEDAQKLPYEEMARRYAHYKHWKDAPLMGWLRGDEGREAKMEKIRKQFDKAVDERIARLTDDELKDNLGRSRDMEERRRYARLIHSRIGGNGEDAQNAKEEWQRNYQVLMQYDDISEDELLSKKKAEAKARGDQKAVKRIQKAEDRIREKGKRKLGGDDDSALMQQIRQWRREALEDAMRAEGGGR